MKPVSLNKKIGIASVHIAQVLVLIGVGILQYYTRLRPLLMRHIYTRNLQYSEGFFTDGLRLFQSIVLLAIGLGVLYLWIKRWNRLHSLLRLQGIIFGTICFITIGFMNLNYFQTLITYPYWIFAGYGLLFLQAMVLNMSR